MRALDPTIPSFIGPFRITRRLGAGGMAEVFEGAREGPGGFLQRVCVKRVLPDLGHDPETRRLFQREARLVASLRHRNIARVVDYGETATGRYLALELVDGVDLRQLLRSMPDRRLPAALASRIGLEVGEALEHAHERGIVHRDVSPANILISVDGEVKLTDFGIGKAIDVPLGPPSVLRGNLWYMAPERFAVDTLPSPRSDVFSLGVVLYETLTGSRPYSTPPTLATTPVSLPLLEVCPAMQTLVERAMAFEPARRPDARGLVEQLAPAAADLASRRALAELVRRCRDVERPSPRVRTRWRRYAVSPGVWADAERVAQLRGGHLDGRIAPDSTTRDDDTLPALPPAWKTGWIACGVAVVSFATVALAGWLALGP